MTTATLEQVWVALEGLTDPEIPVVTLRELGILRDVRSGPDGLVEVVITPTYSGCPAMGQIEDDVRATLESSGIAARVTKKAFEFFGVACLLFLILAMVSSIVFAMLERWAKRSEVAR